MIRRGFVDVRSPPCSGPAREATALRIATGRFGSPVPTRICAGQDVVDYRNNGRSALRSTNHTRPTSNAASEPP